VALPRITPQFADATGGAPWPTTEWLRAESSDHAELEAVVDEAFTSSELASTNAVLVIQHGRIVAERYGGVREFFDRDPEPITADSPLLSWSMAKSMLHFIVGTLVAEGRLDPEGPAPVPEWREPGDPRGAIRLRDLLAMRDGLDFVENYELGQVSHVIEMLFGDGKEDMAHYVASRPLAHAPDTVFNYSSGTTNIISRIVADQVGYGDHYRAFLRERLFGPLGMTSAEATFDAAGVWIASSYVHATARDFAKFGLLYLRGGHWDNRPLIPRSWCETAQIPLSRDDESGHYYAWQWWVSGDPFGTYWANGYEGQMISVVPALDALVVRFGHTPAEHYPDLYRWRSRVLDVLARS
jgi:CubicO group peptidase (beta-lactamase class C family)